MSKRWPFLLLLAFIVWMVARRLLAWAAPRPSTEVGSLTGEDGEVATGADLQALEQQQRAEWAKALGVAADKLPDLDYLEDEAYDQGSPANWASLGWPTPCGPAEEPRRYCKGVL